MMNSLIYLVFWAVVSAQDVYFPQHGGSVIGSNFPGSSNLEIISRSSSVPQRVIGANTFQRSNIPSRSIPQPIFHIPAPQPRPLPQITIPAPQPLPVFPPVIGLPAPPQSQCDPIGKPLVDEIISGRAYHFSWCHDYSRTYTWSEAGHYCSSLGNGFQAVSIEDQGEDNFIAHIIASHEIYDIWTSGNRLGSYYWSWASNFNTGYTNWSHTGRRGLPQPDNSEHSEHCLAVLNNHYNDGIKWHDENCDRRKLVICETLQFYGV